MRLIVVGEQTVRQKQACGQIQCDFWPTQRAGMWLSKGSAGCQGIDATAQWNPGLFRKVKQKKTGTSSGGYHATNFQTEVVDPPK